MNTRPMKPHEAQLFSRWESEERPYPWTVAHFLDTIDSPISETIVLEEDREAVGFAVVQLIDHEAYILNVMIESGRRRRGRGRQLVDEVEVQLRQRGAQTVFLDVDAQNGGAIRLYERAGFQIVARRPKSYPAGEDSLVMKKDLSAEETRWH